MPIVERWCHPVSCCDPVWEDAYRRFESPAKEIRKFRRRLIAAGALEWPRESAIVELCCGRGNGLKALSSLGFRSLRGVDLSEDLLVAYDGPARLYVGDCRQLALGDASADVVVVQGGLHHLPEVPADLDLVLREIRRVLRPGGLFVAVEPWETPFLKIVHACCAMPAIRRRWDRLDALATMIDRERQTYESWLRQGQAIRNVLHRHFRPDRESTSWGKLFFVGRPLTGRAELVQGAA
jgi:ubiquinone/menaquinone biosynthesis C-methylase UbiE